MDPETRFTRHIETPLGWMKLVSEGEAIAEVQFIKDQTLKTGSVEMQTGGLPGCLSICASQLMEYFQGKRPDFDIPLSPRGTDFQQRVWNELKKIPCGTTISYMELAKRLGDPKVIRAAGSANGKNPIAIFIPCHRVIGSNGELVGYAGGLPLKKWLLNHEQRHYSGISQLSIF
jgi:methylated-DNA-[protein]-cysteine S-methyltransferase